MFQLKLFKSSKHPQKEISLSTFGNKANADLLLEITTQLSNLKAKGAPNAKSDKVNAQYSLLRNTRILLENPSSGNLLIVSISLAGYAERYTVTKAKPGSIRNIAQQAMTLQIPVIKAKQKSLEDRITNPQLRVSEPERKAERLSF